MRENQLQQKVVRYLKKVPNLWYAVINDRHTAGIPDIIVCYKGVFHGIELKVKGNKPTPLQEAQLKLISKAGGRTIVAHSLEEVQKFVQEMG